jgi:hypothetical protein
MAIKGSGKLMAKEHLNARISALTRRQLNELGKRWGTTQTETLTVIIDRMYQQEIGSMKTYIIVNDRYSNEPASTTLDDLRQLCAENNWDVTLYEIHRNGADVIVDDKNGVVAVEPGHEHEAW